MTTFKQLDAFVALADMGSFEAAARRVGVAQSAVSKHVLEFESGFPHPLLDRSKRRAVLTVDGAEVLIRSRAVLARRDAMLYALSSSELPMKKIRIGVTEVVALTWLHRFLDAIRGDFPKVEVELKVEVSVRLREELRSGSLDIVVVPDSVRTQGLFKAQLGSIENEWYCSPAIHPGRRILRPRDLGSFDLLTQGALSRSGQALHEWLRQNDVAPRSIISSSSLLAVIDLMVSGLGVAHLPTVLVKDFLDRGQIREIKVKPAMAAVDYVLLVRESSFSPLYKRVVDLARAQCDFRVSTKDRDLTGSANPTRKSNR